ncbi:MAG: sulfite exporter TauE/SafE family protein [Longimicrobiales bacterium]|nr:sulfite exporter TauE/SafE family protein [Longimicrobiales bacterium]
MVLGLGLAVMVGLALGLLGGGGSILAVPIFVYVLGYGAKVAIAMSLAVVGLTSAFGAVRHWRYGNVDVRVALIFGVVAMVGTYAGARLAAFVTDSFQLALFAGVMAVAAVFMFREGVPLVDRLADRVAGGGHGGGRKESDGAGPPGGGPGSGQGDAGAMPVALIVAEGIGVGVLTGLVGVGGGFLIVPALVLLGGISMDRAVGTSLLVIALKSAAGFVGYLGQVEVPWLFMGWFSLASIAGILAGASLVRFVPQRVLRRSFAGFLVVMATFILYENRQVFTGAGGSEPEPVAATVERDPPESRLESGTRLREAGG